MLPNQRIQYSKLVTTKQQTSGYRTSVCLRSKRFSSTVLCLRTVKVFLRYVRAVHEWSCTPEPCLCTVRVFLRSMHARALFAYSPSVSRYVYAMHEQSCKQAVFLCTVFFRWRCIWHCVWYCKWHCSMTLHKILQIKFVYILWLVLLLLI